MTESARKKVNEQETVWAEPKRAFVDGKDFLVIEVSKEDLVKAVMNDARLVVRKPFRYYEKARGRTEVRLS